MSDQITFRVDEPAPEGEEEAGENENINEEAPDGLSSGAGVVISVDGDDEGTEDSSAQRETAPATGAGETIDYLEKIPYEELTGIIAHDLLKIAESQLGYRESDINTILDENGELRGYSEYGAWYGDDFLPWNAIFVLFCLDCAEYRNHTMVYDGEAGKWLTLLEEQELAAEFGEEQPQPGDLIFTRDAEDSVRVGVLLETRTDEEGRTILCVIEGDCFGSVETAEYEYDPDSGELLAFLTLPESESTISGEEELTEEKEPEEDPDGEGSGGEEEQETEEKPEEEKPEEEKPEEDNPTEENPAEEKSEEENPEEENPEEEKPEEEKPEEEKPEEENPTEEKPGEEEPTDDEPSLEELIAALPVDKLTGDWAADLLTIARSQLGYAESKTDYKTDENGQVSGYTCYGEYNEIPYGEWCAMFVSFCLDYAAVPSDSFPRNAVCSLWVEALEELGLFRAAEDYIPAAGDIVFWGETTKTANHVGIVSGVTEDEETGLSITVIEGNVDACVAERSYKTEGASILGYGVLPQKPMRRLNAAKGPTRAGWDGSSVYYNGVIYINKYAQLSAIGTNAVVHEYDFSGTFGTGGPVILSGSGTTEDPYVNLTYSNDAVYWLNNDIPLPGRTAWSVPAGFSGVFTSEEANGEDNKVLHASDTRLTSGPVIGGTVYYHNVFPMAENAGAVIHAYDYDALRYGEGGLHGRSYITDYNYVLAKNFTASTQFDVTEYTTVTNGSETVQAIVISTYDQLKLVGLGESTLKTDTINGITRTQTVNYPSDAVYYLANDIDLADDGWQLPAGFTGSFTCDPAARDAAAARDRDQHLGADTIYIQNIYQLEMLGLSETERDAEPILSGDFDAQTFGSGSVYTSLLNSSNYLTYGKGNKYVLSQAFSVERVDAHSSVLGSVENELLVNGRDWFGQTEVTIGGTTYILIGDRQQMDAIGTGAYVHGPVYRITQTREDIWHAWQEVADSVVLVYPGDADLVGELTVGQNVYLNADGTSSQDFSQSPLYNTSDYPGLGTDRTGNTRYVYCASDGNGGYNTRATILTANRGTQRYTKDANYIVFRDINMYYGDAGTVTQTGDMGDWIPLMFNGTMYGLKAESPSDKTTLWDSGHSAMNLVPTRKPVISNVNVVAALDTNGFLDLGVQEGVGFFGTITSAINDSTYNETEAIVNNLMLSHGVVTNNAVYSKGNENLIHILADGILGPLLQRIVNLLLTGLTNKPVNITLQQLLDTQRNDPNNLATGAFAGQIIGQARVENCAVECFSVNTVSTYFETGSSTIVINTENGGMVVGKGGFVGHVEGVAEYSGLSSALNTVTSLLENLLNLVPGLGLGDIITLLLRNVLAVSFLTPTGYNAPTVNSCTVSTTVLSTENGKFGVGGFAGSVVGTSIRNCAVTDCDYLTVNADMFGGGFAGVVRDSVISTTLSGLNIIISEGLYPNAELVNCSILGSDIFVEGGCDLGGFVGILSNSYAFNDTVDEYSRIIVQSGRNAYGETIHTQDFVGGFVGEAALGSALTFGDHIQSAVDLLSTVTDLLVDVLKDPSTSASQSSALLDVAGVAPSAVMGCQLLGSVEVSTPNGSFSGGLVGHGEGTLVTSSREDYIRQLHKYGSGALPVSAVRSNMVSRLVSVYAGNSYAGGIAGFLTTANAGGLLGETAGIAQFLGFTVCDTYVNGISLADYQSFYGARNPTACYVPEHIGKFTPYTQSVSADTNRIKNGYTVAANRYYAGGGIGWAVGGDVYDVELTELQAVTAYNYAGGFAGATGPGDLLDGGGLHLTLLGIDLVSAQNLLSVGQGVRTVYTRANVTGITSGFTVEETGQKADVAEANYDAGGYAAQANSVTIRDCHVRNLYSVTANMQDGVAGGFVGESAAGGLASLLDSSNTNLLQALTVNGLLGAVPYLIPKFEGNSVSYVNGGYVQGDTAGGYAGDFQSGFVNRETMDNNGVYETGYAYTNGTAAEPWSVYNIDHVWGGRYAGGWGGKVYSGALASAGSGVSLLSTSGTSFGALAITDLISLLRDYVPIVKYAGVYTYDPVDFTKGFTVYAAHDSEDPSAPATAGMAGGFIGYGSGVQVSYSDVYRLRHGSPTEPDSLTAQDAAAYARFGVRPEALESQDGSNYMIFDNSPQATPYAVTGAYYAGGYIGFMDIGSAASLGGGLNLLSVIDLDNILSALNVVISTIEHSDVTGCAGGFNVVASPRVNLHNGTFGDAGGLGQGYAGGYAGKQAGGHIQDGNVTLFAYIVGEIAAGGYVGEMVSGDVARVADSASVFGSLASATNLLSLVQDFVPTIRNSQTTCIPCGGAVRAQCFSDVNTKRGMAGGYVGHCDGGQIWGQNSDPWKGETVYSGPYRDCAAIRIRSVYGAEYAGGYCGLMECGSAASAGNLGLLGNVITASNVVNVLNAVYPTIYHGVVYGPLQLLDLATWNAWVTYVGSYGAFYPELARLGTLGSQAELDAVIDQFLYGTHVVAGRHVLDNSATMILNGCAGGFVGSMHGGVIRFSEAQCTKLVCAMRAAGGFAGEMKTPGAAQLGNASILDLVLNLGNAASVGNFFVPCVSDAGTTAYEMGLTVQATGDKNLNGVGCAGGFVGGCYGGQLGRDDTGEDPSERSHSGTVETVWTHGLKAVYGTYCIGGFVGKCGAASVLDANTNDLSTGLLQNLLNGLISTPASLLSLVQATMSTIKYAEVTAFDSTWGIEVEGKYRDGVSTDYADYAGGFAGYLEAAVLGERRNAADTLTVTNLRSVNGGYYASGFFGLADVTGVAEVGSGGGTSILNLINLGNTTLLDAFRTYIYYATVTGVPDGITVTAHKESDTGTMRQYQVSGGAGGFGGGLMNGTVEHSSVTGLNTITAPNYAAGFIAQMGKSGVLDLDQLQVGNDSLLGKIIAFLGIDPNVGAQLLSIVGSTVNHCDATGFTPGFIVSTTQTQSVSHNPDADNEDFLTGSCAGGFVGFADTAQIEACSVTNLKYLQSPQAAGGFIGRSAMAYVAEIDVDLTLVNALLTLLSPVINVLYGLTTIDLINIPGGDALGLKLLADGDLVWLNLFGLEIGVSLMRNDPEYEGSSDSLTITLGSSTIKLPYNPADGYNSSAPNASINLIEGNRTSVKSCTVTGIDVGYDVFGGGSGQNTDGTETSLGYAGGFVGYNKMGYFSHDEMILCDVVRGTSGKVGPFVGGMLPGTRGQEYLEGNDNWYSIYRTKNTDYDHVETAGPPPVNFANNTPVTVGGTDYNRYRVPHYEVVKTFGDLRDAQQASSGSTVALNAWYSPNKAVLMLDTPLNSNPESEAVRPDEKKDPCEEHFDLTVHKKWRDYNNMFNTRPTQLEIEVYVIDVGTKPRAQLVQAILPESGWDYVSFDALETQYPGFKANVGSVNPIILRLKPDPDSQIHWSARLEDLPVAYRVSVLDANGDPVTDVNGDPVMEVHYLQYVVAERVPEGYKLVEYQILEDTGSVIILNELDNVVLPGTGSKGNSFSYMLAGIPLFVGMALFCIRKKRRKEVQNE